MVEESGAVLETRRIPEGWRDSRTVMLPETSKANVRALRSIALTSVRYNLMIDGMRTSLKEHSDKWCR